MLGFHTSSVAVGNQIRVILVNRKVVQANQAVCEVRLDFMESHWVIQVVLILMDNALMSPYLPACMLLINLFLS